MTPAPTELYVCAGHIEDGIRAVSAKWTIAVAVRLDYSAPCEFDTSSSKYVLVADPNAPPPPTPATPVPPEA